MIGALTYGAMATDLLHLVQGTEPSTPVGSAAANPIRVRAVAADGVTPVSGATIAWNSTNGSQFSICNGVSSCSVLSDEAGESSSWVTPTAIGQSTITIALAPASYSPPQTQQATVLATSSALDLVAITPTRWIGQGATIAVPLSVEALDLGAPKSNVTINFKLTEGAASLSAGTGITNSSGLATITATLTNQTATVQVSACVAPNNSPCQTFTLFSTPATLWTLENGKRIIAIRADRPIVSAAHRASNRRVTRRKPSHGSNRHLRNHADPDQSRPGRRRLRWHSARLVASAGRDRCGRHCIHHAFRWKRGPVRHVRRRQCGCIERAISNGELGRHSSGATGKYRCRGIENADCSAFCHAGSGATKPGVRVIRRTRGRSWNGGYSGTESRQMLGSNRGHSPESRFHAMSPIEAARD
jgi:hypothetical protein